jgi:lipopolysaccharide/colanic/teichoic acid biosynthesis glycosyltransferase
MREILNVKPGITGIASLYLRNEEELFGTIVGDPDEFYIKVVAPPKIKLAMAHVNNNSIWFDIQLLLLTVWSLTVGRVFQRAEHPIIEEIRQAAAAYQP